MLLKKTQDNSEHAKSYYAASSNFETSYPMLKGDHSVDVVIVGGGFSGVSTAVELCEKGCSVALVEANRISWGASGRNGGQLIGGLGHDPAAFRRTIGDAGVNEIYAMGAECVDIVTERIRKYNIECDLKWGYVEVALKPRHLRDYEEWAKDDEKLVLLDKSALQAYVNSDIYLGGYYKPDWGHLHPLNLCIGEAKVAEEMGAKIFEQSPVERVTYGNSPVIHTSSGSITAGHVIICGNAYLGSLVKHLDDRILPATSCIIATEQLTEEQIAASLPGDVAVCDTRTALDYYRLSADKRLLFGGLSNYSGLEPRNVEDIMRQKMNHVFPALEQVKLDYIWSGQMGISFRRMPQMGRLKGNVLYVGGYSGHGIAPTHVLGKTLAEAVAGNTKRFDYLASINHWKWPGGKLLRRPGMALGMMFYKLADMV